MVNLFDPISTDFPFVKKSTIKKEKERKFEIFSKQMGYINVGPLSWWAVVFPYGSSTSCVRGILSAERHLLGKLYIPNNSWTW